MSQVTATPLGREEGRSWVRGWNRIWYEFIHVKEHRKQGSLKSNSDLSVDLPSFTVVYEGLFFFFKLYIQ